MNDATWRATVTLTDTGPTSATTTTGPTIYHDSGSALVPPPPATTGIPVSKDATEGDGRRLSGLGAGAVVVGLALAAGVSRSRR